MGILADLRENAGIKVPFFGMPAPSTTFPAMVARSLDVPLLVQQTVREPGVRFRFRLETIDVPRTDDRDADIAAATARVQAAFERNIRERPEQWMWSHRRWADRRSLL
jgi:KDO2-lipid IV(A) lauroyltransferase